MEIINAFYNSIRASLDTILQTDSQQLAILSPRDFIFHFCSTPLEPLGIQVLDVEIEREAQLHFSSLPERQNEFLPVRTMREIRDSRRFQVSLHARSPPIEFRASLFFIVQSPKNVGVEEIKIESVELVRQHPRGINSIVLTADRLEQFFRPIAQSSIAALIVEGIKRVLSG